MTTDISRVQLNQVARRRYEAEEPFLFDILDPNINQELSTIKLNGQFVHSQLFINRLLQVPSTMNDKKELGSSLKQKLENLTENDIKNVTEFEEKYSADQAVWWFTRETPLYSSLNKALRVQDIDLIFLFRFFISDIREQLSRLQYTGIIRVYRAQQMSNYELKMLQNSKKKLIAVNSFFATSIDREHAKFRLCLSEEAESNIERVLFEIHLDPAVVTTNPFADVTGLSYFEDAEKEVLIMLGSIFRILDIRSGENDEKNAWVIEMELTGDNDNELKPIIDEIKTNNGEGDSQSSLLLFAHALRDMGKFNDAERYYRHLLDSLYPDNKKMISRCYHALGNVADDKGDHDLSLELLRKAHKILMELPDPDAERRVRIQISLGATYWNKDCLEDALSSYRDALSILNEESFVNTNYLRAMCYINIAEVFLKDKKYEEARKWLEKALAICREHLCKEHDLFGGCYFGFGEVNLNLGRHEIALKYFKDALENYYKSLTSYHFNVADALNSIGKTYETMGDLDQASLYYDKSGTIFRDRLLPTHPKFLENEENKRSVSSRREQSQYVVSSAD